MILESFVLPYFHSIYAYMYLLLVLLCLCITKLGNMEVISHEKNVYLIINLDCFSFTLGQGLMDIIL